MEATTGLELEYKKTKLGLIPIDWKIIKIGDYSSIDKRSLKSDTDDDFKFKYISLSDIFKGKINIPEELISFKSAPSRARRIVSKGDVLLSTVRPNLKSFGIIEDFDEPLIASTGFAVITCNEELNEKYLFFSLFSKILDRQFHMLVVGSNYPAINSADVKNLKIPLPPLAEQVKIAEILTTWEEAMFFTQKLIDQLQLRKKGLMQELLTGKQRLPGFDGEWKELKAGMIFENHSDKSHDGEFEVLSATQDKGVIPRSDVGIDIKYDKSSLKNYKKVDAGDFVISLRSFQGGIEYSSYEGLVSPAYTVLKEKLPISKKFYAEYLKSGNFIKRLNSIIYGIRDGKQISYKEFSSLKLWYPPIDEQQYISTVLEIMDKEIGTYKTYLETQKNQKRGLMQELLTGKKRVKI